MYYDYFGFKQPPFKITPDTSLFYPGGDRGAILDALLYAILNGEGIVKVVGEVGSGKTMLCRMLEQELPEKVEVVYLVNPSISPENTLHAIAFELKLGIQSTTSRFEVMNVLQQYLLQRHSQNRQVVVFVEEAQSMPIATLEEIRLLSNLETQQSKLLQIVLFGQPELDEMIASPGIRQLKERITYSFQLSPFKTNDIREYINTRVRASGYRANELFSKAAIKQIEQYSKGLLRRINILADKALLAAYADNSKTVTDKHTRLAARDSEFLPRSFWSARSVLAAGWVVLLLTVVAIYLYIPNQGQIDPASVRSDIVRDTTMEITSAEPPPAQSEPAPIVNAVPLADITKSEPVVKNELTGESVVIPATTVNPDTSTGPILSQTDSTLVEPEVEPVVSTGPAATAPINDINVGTIIPNKPLAEVPETTISAEIEEVKANNQILDVDSVLPDSTAASIESPENQLLGLNPVDQPFDFGNNYLTPGEEVLFQEQIIKLPPESAEHQQPLTDSTICHQCWSLIYRPMPGFKNL